MASKKTVLFVTYGGGHVRMVIPVLRALEADNHIETVTLALTSAGPVFASEGLPYFAYRDLLLPTDTEALRWGEKLMADHHSDDSGISREESLAYLGLTYWDLVQRHGEEEAARRFAHKGRQALYPLSIMERAMDRFKPDMVVTTNSPRSELAAIEVANRRNIPCMQMLDLFANYYYVPYNADYVTVLTAPVIDNIKKHCGERPGQQFFVTGNPAFDPIFDARGPIDYAWRRQHMPGIPESAKALLWIETPCHYDVPNSILIPRPDDEILGDLEQLSQETLRNNACLLIRPHPSQSRALFEDWMKKTQYKHVFYAHGYPMHDLLRASDAIAMYYSTVGCEALLMERPVLQLNYFKGSDLLPLGELGLSMMIATPQELPKAIDDILHDGGKYLIERARKMLPQEKAAPKIASHISQIMRESTRREAV